MWGILVAARLLFLRRNTGEAASFHPLFYEVYQIFTSVSARAAADQTWVPGRSIATPVRAHTSLTLTDRWHHRFRKPPRIIVHPPHAVCRCWMCVCESVCGCVCLTLWTVVFGFCPRIVSLHEVRGWWVWLDSILVYNRAHTHTHHKRTHTRTEMLTHAKHPHTQRQMTNTSRPARTQCVSIFVITESQLINLKPSRKERRKEGKRERWQEGRKGGEREANGEVYTREEKVGEL